MKKALYIVLLLLLVANFAFRLETKRPGYELIGELMYFPSGQALKALALGFYGPLADLVWLRFIQYYGEHRMTDIKFEMMYHILDVLTTLDPYFDHAYTLGALMLTHDAERPDQARKLLKKGMQINAYEWRIPFMYGFIHYVFRCEYEVAEAYFRIAAQRPDAPDLTKRWAAFVLYSRLGDLETSFLLWKDLYENTANPEERSIAEFYLRKIKMQLDIKYLNHKITEFNNKFGRFPITLKELVSRGLLDSLPAEPHDEVYIIRNHEAVSTWQKH